MLPDPSDKDRFERALTVYREKTDAYVRRADVPPDHLRFLGSVHEELIRRGHYPEAYEIVRLILRGVDYVADPTDRLELSYRAWRCAAVVSSFLGLWRKSIDAYKKAISLGERGAYARLEQSHPGPGSYAEYEPANYRELGSMYGRVGAFGEALANLSIAYERLEEVKRKLDEHTYRDELARLRNARAIVHMDLGEYGEAAGNALAAARIEEDLGEGNPLRFLQAAIDYVTAGRARRELALLNDGDVAPSFAAFRDASRVLARAPSGHRERSDRESEVLLEQGRTHLMDGDDGAALADLRRARSLASEFNLVQHAGGHDLYLGEAHLKLGNAEPAKEKLEEAVSRAEGLGTPETLWQGRRLLARVRRAEDSPEEARNELRRCIEAIEGLRSQVLPESSKISMLGPKDLPYEELVVDLCGPGASDAEITEAFDYAERAKSRVLAERLATGDLPDPAGVPAELVARERELSGDLRALQDLGSRASAAAGAHDRGAKIEEAEGRLREVRERIRASGVAGGEYVAMREGAPLDYEGVRGLLVTAADVSRGNADEDGWRPARVVLVDYFVAEDKVLAFVGREDFDAPRLYEVGVSRDALRDWAELFAALCPCNYEQLWDLGAWQREMGAIVGPIAECSEEGDVVWIVPHRELHRLPLHALGVGGRYLADRNPIFFTPGASVFGYSRTKDPGRAPKTALVLGDSLPEPHDLPSAAEEAIAVAALFDAEAHIGGQATKRLLREELRRTEGEVDVLHLACHGKFEPDAPLRSRIELAPGGGEGDGDPDLTVEDVLGLELGTTLVTLSACESGLSRIHPGEELVGLTRAFLYAGTPALVASLWSVSDESTGVLMGQFYEALTETRPGGDAAPVAKAHALRAAQTRVRGEGRFEHPFHWSAFVLVGDWE